MSSPNKIYSIPFNGVRGISGVGINGVNKFVRETYVPPVPPEPEIDWQTSLLLHMDDEGLSDSSGYDHSVTKYGGASRSNTQSKFGGYSAVFDRTPKTNYLSIPHSSGFSFGQEGGVYTDWTVEAWIYITRAPVSGNTYDIISCNYSTTKYGWGLYLNESRIVTFTYYDSANPYTARTFSTGTAVGLNAWHHIAIVRNGNTLRAFYNGSPTATPTHSIVSGRFRANDSSVPLAVGRGPQSNSSWYDGWIDEVRISKGIARWTSAFTPPTEPYSVIIN